MSSETIKFMSVDPDGVKYDITAVSLGVAKRRASLRGHSVLVKRETFWSDDSITTVIGFVETTYTKGVVGWYVKDGAATKPFNTILKQPA